MTDETEVCCPDCAENFALRRELAEQRALAAEAAAARAALEAETRVRLEQAMEAGQDITPTLDALSRAGFDLTDLLLA